MSIYDKSIAHITTQDLQALVDENAVENVRLEFKRDDPTRDEWLEKLSSFANTYGGYLVIGVAADSHSGRVTGLPGVAPISGFKQRIVQWCWNGVSPPIDPFVSDPIATPADASKVCYVVQLDESLAGPHFINSRKGTYIRTDEFSQRFEPQLATQAEIQHLLNRRSLVVDRRGALLERADDRFNTFVDNSYREASYTTGDLGATLKVVIIPQLPVEPLIDHHSLLRLIPESRVPWRGELFPTGSSRLISQHESAIELEPGDDFSMFEANIWGQLYYASEIAVEEGNAAGIHINSLIGHLLVYLEHARLVYSKMGFHGRLQALVRLERILNVPLLIGGGGALQTGPFSRLDRGLEFTIDFLTTAIETGVDEIAAQLLETIMLSLNWPAAATPTRLNNLISEGRKYNFW